MPTSVSPVRRKQRFLPMKRRIDREINKIKFAYAGEIALGLTVSYGTLSSDDTDYLLILDNLNLNGSIFTINPSVGYFFKDNMSAGVRFGYTNINGTLDTGNFNLGEQNDVNLAFKNLHLQSSALSVGLYFRSYAGLDSKGHFGLFGEVDLSMKTGNSEFTYETEGTLRSTFSDDLKLSLGFNPGLAVYIFPNVCSTVSFGLGGIEYTKIKQKDANERNRPTNSFENAVPPQPAQYPHRRYRSSMEQESQQSMMKHFRHILIGTLLLLTSCIENSIPYPVVTLQILGVEGEGFTCSPEDINTQERIVTLHLDEQTDISNVKIDKISVTENAGLRNPSGTFDLRTPLYLTLFVLSGLRMDDRSGPADRTLFRSGIADRRCGNRRRSTYGESIRSGRDRFERSQGHAAETRSGRHHHDDTSDRRADFVRIGPLRLRRLPRLRREMVALRRSYRYQGTLHAGRCLERGHLGLCRRQQRGRTGIPLSQDRRRGVDRSR